jgi:YbbR domain-containing protein
LRGWKDYTKPITIEAVTVETLPVDIKAQTIGNIAVDIAAQTLAQLNVNIAASAITLQVNIASVTAGVVFNVAQSGSWTVNAAQTGTWTINIGAPLDAGGNLKTAVLSSVQLDVNIAASAVTLNVAIQSSTVTLNVDVTNPALTVGQASPALSFDGVDDYVEVRLHSSRF